MPYMYFFSYLVQLISRLAFVLRVYLGNFDAFQQKYTDIKARLDQLSSRHREVEKMLRETLEKVGLEVVSCMEVQILCPVDSSVSEPQISENLAFLHPIRPFLSNGM